MSNLVIVGAQWGDEGKGKVVDVLAEKADAVVRFAGGNNAGHTIRVGEDKIVTHLVPSGCAYPGTKCVLGAGMVIDLDSLSTELTAMRSVGYLTDPNDLLISYDAHLVLPFHRNLDAAREARRGARAIGTTKRGIGPAYASKALRCGIRMRDLLDDNTLHAKLLACSEMYDKELVAAGFSPVDADLEPLWALRAEYRDYFADVGKFIHDWRKKEKNILFEGAQGAMLDIDHGTYPYVTSSNTIAGGVCAGVGMGPTCVDAVWGITKAYTTRVGNGPFPTQAPFSDAQMIRERGDEFGATTGRPRDCGWLDIPQLRYSARVNGMSGLCVTKLDVLLALPHAKICTHYEEGDPGGPADLTDVSPHYAEIPSLGDPDIVRQVQEAKNRTELPYAARWVLAEVEVRTGVPVTMVSTGQRRSQVLQLEEAWV